jgi:hypothetical protein
MAHTCILHDTLGARKAPALDGLGFGEALGVLMGTFEALHFSVWVVLLLGEKTLARCFEVFFFALN